MDPQIELELRRKDESVARDEKMLRVSSFSPTGTGRLMHTASLSDISKMATGNRDVSQPANGDADTKRSTNNFELLII